MMNYRWLVASTIGGTAFLSLILYNSVNVLLQATAVPWVNPWAVLLWTVFDIFRKGVVPIVLITAYLVWSLNPFWRIVEKISRGEAVEEKERLGAVQEVVRFKRRVFVYTGLGYAIGFLTNVLLAIGSSQIVSAVYNTIPSVFSSVVNLILLMALLDTVLHKPRQALGVFRFDEFGAQEMGFLKKSVLFTALQTAFVIYAVGYLALFLSKTQVLYHQIHAKFHSGELTGEEALGKFAAEVERIAGFQVPDPQGLDFHAIEPDWNRVILFSLVMGLFMTALSAVLAFAFGFFRQRQIQSLPAKLEQLSSGQTADLLRLESPDEVGLIMDRINTLIRQQRHTLRKLEGASLAVSRTSENLDEVVQGTDQALKKIFVSAEKIQQAIASQGAILASTREAYQNAAEKLVRVVQSIQDQTVAVNDTSSAIHQMAASINSVYKTTQAAKDIAARLSVTAQSGFQSLNQGISAIQSIAKASAEIRQLVSGIAKISSQTNLLAMNAAIEAAHAGEAGKGFAVVAEEVRNLAVSSSQLTRRITGRIQEMMELVENGVKVATQAGESLQEIEQDIRKTVQMVSEIASAMTEQNAGAQLILQNIANLVRSMELTGQAAEESREVNLRLETNIRSVLEGFQTIELATHEGVDITAEVRRFSNRLMEIAKANTEVIGELRQVISGYLESGTSQARESL